MVITPQARRRITGAIRAVADARARDRWGVWAEGAAPTESRSDIPPEIVLIALEALEAAVHGIRARLDIASLDEDHEADLLNDLGYLQAIEAALRSEIAPNQSAR